MGPREGAAGNSGWKIKPEKVKGEACGKDATMQLCGLRVAGEGGREELDSASRSWRLRLRVRGPLGPPRDKVGGHQTPSSLVSTSEPT